MARPKSNDKRNAILDAAVRVIVVHGLNAPTALIAREAGVSNGSLFTYFETKADLYNQLYLQIKTEMADTALNDLPTKGPLRKQAFHVWSNWMKWATTNAGKRRVLAQLSVSDQITPESRAIGQKIMAGFIDLMERMRSTGSLRNASMNFAGAIMNALADATMDFMISEPAKAEEHCLVGFETFWRAIK